MGQNGNKNSARQTLPKTPTGIAGLDAISSGGLPKERITLVLGGAGTGKTVLTMETLVRGITRYDEPGVFISLEETREELVADFASFSFDINELINRGKLAVDHISIEQGELVEAGEYELEGLLLRIENLISSVGAERVVLDGIPALFYGFSNSAAVRRALGRLLRWLKDRGITTLVTAEMGTELMQRGLGRTLCDCIIQLSEEVHSRIATRYLKIDKYRGSLHFMDQFPFLITGEGISVLPVTAIELDYEVSEERVATGITELDTMLDGGYYRGSSILISGEAGTGKSSIGASLAASVCRQGERCILFSMEESGSQFLRNMKSVGIDLEPWNKKGLLRFHAMRPTGYGLEMHLITMENIIREHKPAAIILDPVSDLQTIGSSHQVRSMASRLVDFLKANGITSLFTALTEADGKPGSEVDVSSLMDTWIMLRNREATGEQTRLLSVIKSRGMAHSNQVREFLLTNKGVKLEDVYLGPEGVLTGSARAMQEVRDRMEAEARRQEIDDRKRQFEQKQKEVEARIGSLQAEIKNEERELQRSIKRAEAEDRIRERQRREVGRKRMANTESQPGTDKAANED